MDNCGALLYQRRVADLVIFDCDGVLVDSEPLSNRVIAELFVENGLEMTPEESLALFAGTTIMEAERHFYRATGKGLPLSFEDDYRRRSYDLFEKELKAMDGAKALLEQLQKKRCVASNGPRRKIEGNLRITGLLGYFDAEHLHSAYDVQAWKPKPDLYLHVAHTHGVSPKACVVIEDSVHGVQAARAADMAVYGFSTRDSGDELAAAGAEMVSSLGDLAAILG